VLCWFLPAGGDEATGSPAEDFQGVRDKIGRRFGATASQGDVDKRGHDANENPVQDEA
jgi:hypothetical protein